MTPNQYLSKSPQLKALCRLVEHDFSSKGLVHHNWNHVLRDLARGIMIGEAEGADMRIVLAGVLLHDIGRIYPEEEEDHHTSGAKAAPKYLTKAGYTKREIDEWFWVDIGTGLNPSRI